MYVRHKILRIGPKGLCGARRATVPAEGWHPSMSLVLIIICQFFQEGKTGIWKHYDRTLEAAGLVSKDSTACFMLLICRHFK